MNTLWQDIRYALRQLRKNPGFTFTVVLILALGIGANTTIYSAVNAFLIRPLPFEKSEELVMVWTRNLGQGFNKSVTSGPNYLDWRQQNRVFQDMGAMQDGERILTGGGEPVSVSAMSVTPSYLRVLRIQPILGRAFAEDEDQTGKSRVVILNYSMWQNRFDGRQDVIGKSVLLDGETYTVVGVLPPRLGFLDRPGEAAWIPLPAEKLQQAGSRGLGFYTVLARLNPGVSIAQSQAAMTSIAQQLEKAYPDSNTGSGSNVVPLREELLGGWPDRPTLFLLQGAVLLVLFIASANAANLLLARAASRRPEISIRLALGSSRFRLVRQLLFESVLLAALGGMAGVALTALGIATVNHWLHVQDIRLWTDIQLDGAVLIFSSVLSSFTGILFGLAPALQTTKPDLQTMLKGTEKTSAGATHHRTLNALAVSEIGLAMVLLIGAVLFVRNLVQLHQTDPGFDPRNVLTMKVTLPQTRYAHDYDRNQFVESVVERLHTMPNVRGAATIDFLPMAESYQWVFQIEGRPSPSKKSQTVSEVRRISWDYFRTLSTPLLQGRTFTKNDRRESTPVVIINEAMAHRYFPGENPIGARLNITDDQANPRMIVGVVRDQRMRSLKGDVKPMLYIPYTQGWWGMIKVQSLHFLIRTDSNRLSLVNAIRHEIQTLDPELAFTDVLPLERFVDDSILSERVGTCILGSFSLIALILAALGIYGVMANAISQRTREIGIRRALGAQAGDIYRLVVGKGMVLTVFGIGIGLAGSFGVTRFLASFLYGISPTDAGTFVVASVFLAAVSFLACYLPARRAVKVDPMVALRYE